MILPVALFAWYSGDIEKVSTLVMYSQCADNKLIQNGIKILPLLISMKSKTINRIMYHDYYEYCFLLLVFIWFAYVLYILILGNFERRLNCDMNLKFSICFKRILKYELKTLVDCDLCSTFHRGWPSRTGETPGSWCSSWCPVQWGLSWTIPLFSALTATQHSPQILLVY